MWRNTVLAMAIALFGAQVILAESSEPSRRQSAKKPAGWVGGWPPAGAAGDAAEKTTPGGGDTPVATPSDAPAVSEGGAPPTEESATEAPPSSGEEVVAGGGAAPPGSPVATEERTTLPVLDSELLEPRGPTVLGLGQQPDGPLAVNPEGLDIPRAMPPDVLGGDDAANLRSEFNYSTDRQKAPEYIYTRYGFASTIEFENGEKPVDAFCPLCNKESGDFGTERVGNMVLVWPKAMSNAKDVRYIQLGMEGVLGTNLVVETDSGKSYVFEVYEITGLAGFTRTAKHIVRGQRGQGDLAVGFSYEARVEQATTAIRKEYDSALEVAKDTLLDEKVGSQFEVYTDFEVESKSKRGRRISLESVAVVGDRTVIKFHAPGDVSLSSPVAMVAYGSQLRVLKTISANQERKEVDDEDYVFFTLTTEAASLSGKQRIAISLSDLDNGKEMRSSAGRS